MRLVRTSAALAALSLALPAHATMFTEGEFLTGGQLDWGETPGGDNYGTILENNYNSVFAPSELVEVGIPGSAGFSIIFDNPDDVITYLPANGVSGPLTADLLDPTSSASSSFGGEVLALALNVAFSDHDVLAHPPGVHFGDLVFQNLDTFAAEVGLGPEISELDGRSVRQGLAEADLVLGGDTATPFTVDDMVELVASTNMVFDAGVNSTFDKFLAFPSSTAPVPEPSTWAMLLIGFASLGFVRYRASRCTKAAAARV
jgi:hypothetical protein